MCACVCVCAQKCKALRKLHFAFRTNDDDVSGKLAAQPAQRSVLLLLRSLGGERRVEERWRNSLMF